MKTVGNPLATSEVFFAGSFRYGMIVTDHLSQTTCFRCIFVEATAKKKRLQHVFDMFAVR